MISTVPSNQALKTSRWLFVAYVALLPIVRPLDFRYLGIHIQLTDLVFATSFGLWIWTLRSRRPFFDQKFAAYTGAFLTALILSALFSTEQLKSGVKLIGVGYLIAVALLTADLIQDLGILRRIIFAWLIGSLLTVLGTAAGVIGYYAGYDSSTTNFFLFHYGSLPVGHYPRAKSFFENPNMTANYLNVVIMFALAAGRTGWISARASLISVVAIFVSALFTISAGLGGLVLSISLWIAFGLRALNRTICRAILVGGIVTASLAFVSSAISPVRTNSVDTITLPFTKAQIEPSVRAVVWKNAIERGMEFPLIGRGTGTDAADVKYTVLSGQKQWLRDAHQAWLNVFGQAGIFGFAAFVALCFYLLSITRFRNLTGTVQETYLIASSCAFVGAFLLQNLFGSFEDARHLWVLIGMLVGLNRAVKNSGR